jgi:hypothetical protein
MTLIGLAYALLVALYAVAVLTMAPVLGATRVD